MNNFLSKFTHSQYIGRVIFEAYQGGRPDQAPKLAKDLNEMLARIGADIDYRLKYLTIEEMKRDLALLLEVLTDEETIAHCKSVVNEEKKRLRNYVPLEKPATVAPSDKQMAYLRRLGYKGSMPRTMRECSKLIKGLK